MSHWYAKDGSPKHFEAPNRKPTSLREARKSNGWVPSVTTILNVVSKPALTNWIAEEAAMTAAEELFDAEWTLPQFNTVSSKYLPTDRQWARGVCARSREKTMAKADAGTAIHNILEDYFKGEQPQPCNQELCESVWAMLVDKCGLQKWIPEATVVNIEMGYGGKCDLHSKEWVVDFKTKDEVNEKTRGYGEQAAQLAAYAHGLGLGHARTANLFISRSDGALQWFEHKDTMAWERFKAALMLWQVTKKYGPLYEAIK